MRRPLRTLVVFSGSLLLAGLASAETPPDPPLHPNILLIIADDVGSEMFGLYPIHHTDPATTPKLDALAAEGVMFTNAWSNPYCAATRATIQTGRYGHRTGVRAGPGHLQETQITLAEELAAAGYKSAVVGKWGLANGTTGWQANTRHAVRAGYDYFAGSFGPTIGSSYFSWPKYFAEWTCAASTSHENDSCIAINPTDPNTTPNGKTTEYATIEHMNDAWSWIQLHKTQPWFVALSFNAAHAPVQAPPASLHHEPLTTAEGEHCFSDNVLCYRAMIEAMDQKIEDLLDELDANIDGSGVPELDQTMVIFVGDNGTPGGSLSMQPGRAKGTVFQRGVSVPLILNGPGVVPNVSEALVNTSDLFMTILDLAHVDPTVTADHDSYSLAPILADVTDEIRHYAYAETIAGKAKAIRNRDGFKLHRRMVNAAPLDVRWYFYDLANDPHENVNLVNETASTLALKTSEYTLARQAQLLELEGVLGSGDLTATDAPLPPTLPAANRDQDADGDECPNGSGACADNCPSVPNPDQADADADGVGDACDDCPDVEQVAELRCDTDKDGYGNICDGDFDNDGDTIPADFDIWYADAMVGEDTEDRGTDMNCDTYVDATDFTHWNEQFSTTGVPGPSGLRCAGMQPCVLP